MIDPLVELTHDHIGELSTRMIADHVSSDVVKFHGIRHAQERSRSGPHPYRLVIDRPAQTVRVSGFDETIRRISGFFRCGAHPAQRPYTEVPRDRFGRFADDPRFVMLP